MKIKSSDGKPSVFDMNIGKFLDDSPYIKAGIFSALAIILIIDTQFFGWGFNIFLTLGLLVVCTFFINHFINYRDYFNWPKYFLTMSILICISTPGTFFPVIHDYKNNERINELLPVENNTLLYNDPTYTFILIFPDRAQPYVLEAGNSQPYNRLKAGYLDGKFKVEKRRIKEWHDDEDEITTDYYLDGFRFQ